MKTKLLRKLRQKGRNQITILSVTKSCGMNITGMKYAYNDDCYSGLFGFGDSESEVKEKAAKVYLNENIDYFRKRYLSINKRKK